MEKLIFKYNTILKWIDVADTKANIVLVVELAIIGFVLSMDLLFHTKVYLGIGLSGAFLILSLVTLFFLLRTIKPRVKNNQGNSKIFFQDIANSNEQVEIIDEIQKQSDGDFERDVSIQIAHMASVCKNKHQDVSRSIVFLALQIIVLILIVLFL